MAGCRPRRLVLLAGSGDCQAPATAPATILKDRAPATRLEPLAEAVRAKAAGVVGLIGAFHLSLDTGNRMFMRVNPSTVEGRRQQRTRWKLGDSRSAGRRSLAVWRHLRFLEHHVLADDRIVLFDL